MWLQNEEPAVHPCTVTGRLLLEARDPRAVDEDRTVAARWLDGGQRRHPSVGAMKRNQTRDVEVGHAITVSKTEGLVIEICANALESPTR